MNEFPDNGKKKKENLEWYVKLCTRGKPEEKQMNDPQKFSCKWLWRIENTNNVNAVCSLNTEYTFVTPFNMTFHLVNLQTQNSIIGCTPEEYL